MNKTAKVVLSIISFVIAVILIVVTFFDFILICGQWKPDASEMDMDMPISAYMEFDIFGKVSVGVDGNGSSMYKQQGMSYKFENSKLVMYVDGEMVTENPYSLGEGELVIYSDDEYRDIEATLVRKGLSFAWILRIVGGVFAAFGVVLLLLPTKRNTAPAPVSYASEVTYPSAPAPAYAPAPEAPVYGYAPAPGAPVSYAPAPEVFEAPAPAYAPAPEAPVYGYAPAPETPVSYAPAPEAFEAPAPAYAPAPEAPAYTPVDLPKSEKISDSERFKPAGDL